MKGNGARPSGNWPTSIIDIENMISTHTVGSGRSGWSQYYNIDGTTKTHGVELTLGRKLSRDLDVKVTSNWTSASNKVASAESSAHGVDGIADNITTLQLAYDDHRAYGYNATLWEQWVHDYYESDSSQTYSYNTLNFVINKNMATPSASLPVSIIFSIRKSMPSISTAAFGARASNSNSKDRVLAFPLLLA